MGGLVYRNFDIRLTPDGADAFRMDVHEAPAGDAVGSFRPPFSPTELVQSVSAPFVRTGLRPRRVVCHVHGGRQRTARVLEG